MPLDPTCIPPAMPYILRSLATTVVPIARTGRASAERWPVRHRFAVVNARSTADIRVQPVCRCLMALPAAFTLATVRDKAGRAKRTDARAVTQDRIEATEVQPAARKAPIYLRASSNPDFVHCIERTVEFEKLAIRWTNSVRNRHRWRLLDSEAKRHEDRLAAELSVAWKLESAGIEALSRSHLVEVELPPPDVPGAGRAYEFPWEYVLSAATRSRRQQRRMTVVRTLGLSLDEATLSRAQDVARTLFVECAPGQHLREFYNFDAERFLIETHVRGREGTEHYAAQAEFGCLADPSSEALAEELRRFNPDIIHLVGAGIEEGTARLKFKGIDPTPVQGGLFLNSTQGPVVVGPDTVAELLNGAERAPVMVCFNLDNTTPDPAVQTLDRGALHVVSIRDSLEADFAKLLFSHFFRSWRRSGYGNAVQAFDDAYRTLPDHHGILRGSGIAFWSRHSLIRGYDSDKVPALNGASFDNGSTSSIEVDISSVEAVRNFIHCDIRPIPQMNFSILHNRTDGRGQLFEKFEVLNKTPATLVGLHVVVDLHIGSDRFPYRQSFKIDSESSRDLSEYIRVPLTSELARGIHESVRTSLYVHVSYRDLEVREHTYEVTLSPVNEWQDDNDNGIWLPSFILPRDPAINPLIASAVRYLKAIADKPDRSFHGYLGSGGYDESSVAEQVQAIWSTLVHDYQIEYISPPPSYIERSQRLRTPTEVVTGRAGTCIDLALLIAACLEYIDLYPVIVLFKGHACVGYWNSPDASVQFVDAGVDTDAELRGESVATPAPDVRGSTPAPEHEEFGWIVRDADEFERFLDSRALTLIETVNVTKRLGFGDSLLTRDDVDASAGYQFDYMVDLKNARKHKVTPLPLFGGIP